MMSSDSTRFAPPFGINLIGSLSDGSGFGNTTRAIASLLRAKGVPFALYHVPHAWAGAQCDSRFAASQVASPAQLTQPINLYVLPAVCFETFFDDNPAFLAGKRLHVANVWWEASRFPPHWIDILARFDGILAMSHFIAEICRNQIPMTPTLYGEHPLDIPLGIQRDRRHFGIPADAVVFVASLDPNSDPARKNPEALIAAFRAAFPAADLDVRLVMRINNAGTAFGQRVVRRLLQLAEGDGRISFLLDPMNYEEVLSLYACGDIHLSLHRGEGLGLGMLESMTLGSATIATGWSGNLSYMNHSNSALLRYRLVPVSGHYKFFHPEVIGPGARWAEPAIEDAVAWMRKLREDRALREILGERARASAIEYQHRANEARWLLELMNLWQAQTHLPRAAEKFS
jgi:glycosyltransferase involved in cell wall biosynthesis